MKKVISITLAILIILSTMLIGASAADGKWIASWGTSAVDYYIDLGDIAKNLRVNGSVAAGTTARTEIIMSASGTKLRLQFSNQYGDTPVIITEAAVARTGSSAGTIDESTSTQIHFNGKKSLTLEPGTTVWCDPIDFAVSAREKISVSAYYAGGAYVRTAGLFGGTTYTSRGIASQVSKKKLASKSDLTLASSLYTFHIVPFLVNADVYSSDPNAFSAVFIGDSTLVNNTTNYVSERLVESGYSNIGIVNEGIMGNRLLYNGTGLLGQLYGDNVLSRFDRDALNLTSVDVIVVKIGANDVLHPSSKSMSAPYASVDEITDGFKQLINRAKAQNKKIYFMEITPWNGYVREVIGNNVDVSWSPKLQVMTDEVNAWIREEAVNAGADGFFSAPKLCDAKDRTKLAAQYTIDGAHLTDAGSMILADSIDLSELLDLDDAIDKISTILGIDPESQGKVNIKVNKLKNVINIIKQLGSTLRVQFEYVRDFFAKLTSRTYRTYAL